MAFEREVWQAFITNNSGNVQPNAQIAVFDAGTSNLSIIYSDLTGAPRSNPFNTGSDGLAKFYAEPARYRVQAQSSAGIAVYDDVDLSQKALRNDLAESDGFELVGGLGNAATRTVQTSPTDATSGRVLTVGAQRAALGNTVYGRDNILGTVSQSGGTPTGAIIERGSNSDGEYDKYAGGTLICWRQATVDLTDNTNQEFAFPTNFDASSSFKAASHSVQVDGGFSSNADRQAFARSNISLAHTPSGFDGWTFRTDGSGTLTSTTRARFLAIGRWF